MLYHFVGMSCSSRRNWVLSPALVAMSCLLRILGRRVPVKSALTIRKGDRPCQYRRLLDSCRRRGCHGQDAAPAARRRDPDRVPPDRGDAGGAARGTDQEPHRLCRSEEHTSELQSRLHLVCRLLLEKKKKKKEIIDMET